GFLPIVAIVLMLVGAAVIIAGLILHDVMRHLPRPTREMLAFLVVGAGSLIEVASLGMCLSWLYQAWRIILHEDEDYSSGLMVGLLLVPFFNLYGMFPAIPGLSTAIQQELQLLAPTRVHSTGWVPGLAACILVLIPVWGLPVAACMFLAWMLIANHS